MKNRICSMYNLFSPQTRFPAMPPADMPGYRGVFWCTPAFVWVITFHRSNYPTFTFTCPTHFGPIWHISSPYILEPLSLNIPALPSTPSIPFSTDAFPSDKSSMVPADCGFFLQPCPPLLWFGIWELYQTRCCYWDFITQYLP